MKRTLQQFADGLAAELQASLTAAKRARTERVTFRVSVDVDADAAESKMQKRLRLDKYKISIKRIRFIKYHGVDNTTAIHFSAVRSPDEPSYLRLPGNRVDEAWTVIQDSPMEWDLVHLPGLCIIPAYPTKVEYVESAKWTRVAQGKDFWDVPGNHVDEIARAVAAKEHAWRRALRSIFPAEKQAAEPPAAEETSDSESSSDESESETSSSEPETSTSESESESESSSTSESESESESSSTSDSESESDSSSTSGSEPSE